MVRFFKSVMIFLKLEDFFGSWKIFCEFGDFFGSWEIFWELIDFLGVERFLKIFLRVGSILYEIFLSGLPLDYGLDFFPIEI